MVRIAGNHETAFKFHRSVKIDGNGTVTVWSSDAGVTHEPPQTIVMKQQKWFVSENMKTQLLNSDGDEVAATERLKHNITTSSLRHREGVEHDSNTAVSTIEINLKN